ncbi:MAG TPA: hypothetical protein VLV56_02560 [Burkholderiales bacterium]|nr:hypothetical protein [Burkholderiales bacterium]
MKSETLWLLFLAVCSSFLTEVRAQSQSEQCERLWSQASSTLVSQGVAAATKALESQSKACEGTGIFESRLATLYFQAKRYDDAEKLLTRALSRPTQYQKELRFGLGDLDVERANYQGAEAKGRGLVQDYPNWHGGYRLLAKTFLVQKKFKESIENGLAANRLTPESGVYLGLAMAYYQLDMLKETVAAVSEARKLDPRVVGRPAGINEAIYSLVQMGREDEARDLAQARVSADPNWRTDATLVRAIQHLQKRSK